MTGGASDRERCLGLAQSRDRDGIPFLIQSLEKGDRGVQDAAFDALSVAAAEPTAAGLLPLLLSRDERARNLARELLQPLGRASLPHIGPYLSDPDPNVRIFAAEIIGLSREERAVELIRPLAGSDQSNVRNQAAISLGALGFPSARETLEKLAKDSDEWVRFAAEEALDKIKPGPGKPEAPAAAKTAPVLAPEQFTRFRDFIMAKSGLHFSESKKYLLEGRLSLRVAALGLRGADDYLNYLKADSRGPEELGRLFEALTNNETSFFRTAQHFDLFRDELLPKSLEYRRRVGSSQLRIWSAGCSTGEEPYTLALLVREALGPDLGGREVKLFAYDISARALDVARAGLFSEAALRPVPPDLRARYFQPQGGGQWLLDARIRSLVGFQNVNLSALSPQGLPRDLDVIFCRNVMMYFDAETKKRLLGCFFDALRNGGYLVVGATESLHGVTRALTMRVHERAVVYEKEEGR